MSSSNIRSRLGFTVIELLLILTSVAILLALLFGAVQRPHALAPANVAVGFEYTSNYKMKSVLVPKPLKGGQSKFELVVEGQTFPLDAGKRFFFRPVGYANGVDSFTIRGINESEQLDPNDTMAFPTGISWMQDNVQPEVVMKPIAKRRSQMPSGWVIFGTLSALALGGAFVAVLVWRRKTGDG